MSALQEQINDA